MNRKSLATIFVSTKQFLTTGMFLYSELPDEKVIFKTSEYNEIADFRNWLDYISKSKVRDVYLAEKTAGDFPGIAVRGEAGDSFWHCSVIDDVTYVTEEKIALEKKGNSESLEKLIGCLKAGNDQIFVKALTLLNNESTAALNEEEKKSVEFIKGSGLYHTKAINTYLGLILISDRVEGNVKRFFEESYLYVLNFSDCYCLEGKALPVKYPQNGDHVQNAIAAWENSSGALKFNLSNFVVDEVVRSENRYLYLDPETFDASKKIGEPYSESNGGHVCFYLFTSKNAISKFAGSDAKKLSCMTCLSADALKCFLLLCQFHERLSVVIDPSLKSIQIPMEQMSEYIYGDNAGALVQYPDLSFAPGNDFPFGRYYVKTPEEVDAEIGAAEKAEQKLIESLQGKKSFWKKIFG